MAGLAPAAKTHNQKSGGTKAPPYKTKSSAVAELFVYKIKQIISSRTVRA